MSTNKGKVRARVWSTGRFVPRGRLRRGERHRSTGLTWHFAVYNSAGEVVLYDNTGAYKPILNAALIRVEALRHMEIAGHKLKPYSD